MVIGLSMDEQDNVWIVHRPQTLEQKESYAARSEADCCTAAPDVLEFDPQAGNLMRHWGRDEAGAMAMTGPAPITASPSTRTRMSGWAAMAPISPLPPPGSAAQFAPGATGRRAARPEIAAKAAARSASITTASS